MPFFTTNTVKAKQDDKPTRFKVILSQDVKIKQFPQTFDLNRFRDVQKRETRKVEGAMFTSELGDYAAREARAKAAAEAKAARAKRAKAKPKATRTKKAAPKKRAVRKTGKDA